MSKKIGEEGSHKSPSLFFFGSQAESGCKEKIIKIFCSLVSLFPVHYIEAVRVVWRASSAC